MITKEDLQFIIWTRLSFSLKQSFFLSRRQAFAGSTTWFLRSWENVTPNNFQHHRCMGAGISCTFYGHCNKWQPHCNGSCYSQCFILTGVVPWIEWQMLLRTLCWKYLRITFSQTWGRHAVDLEKACLPLTKHLCFREKLNLVKLKNWNKQDEKHPPPRSPMPVHKVYSISRKSTDHQDFFVEHNIK